MTTRGGTRRVPLRLGRDGVDDLVREYLRTLSPTHTAPGDPAALRPLAVRAWSELFAPAAPLLGDAAVLVVVPDASLYRLPFGALHDGERYLVERYELATAPSINVLDVLLQRPRRPRASFLGVADPLDNLPAARDEVAHAGSGWPSARILEGSAATPEAVVAALPDADVVHLAAHGQLLSRTAPSYLELAGGDGMRPLDSDAILQLRMQASLVTLSACKSARGGHTGGEALVNSLARSFLAAGAATVVGSLWDVDDQGTAELMRVFYDALPDRSVAGALAHAQRSLAAESHPWFWAGFTAVGDPR